MINEPTIEKLHAMKLYTMASAWSAQRENTKVQELGFDERLAMLVDAEANARDNKRLAKLLYDAKLRIGNACMEDVDLNPKRDIDKALFRQLMTGRWIADHQNVLAVDGDGSAMLRSCRGHNSQAASGASSCCPMWPPPDRNMAEPSRQCGTLGSVSRLGRSRTMMRLLQVLTRDRFADQAEPTSRRIPTR